MIEQETIEKPVEDRLADMSLDELLEFQELLYLEVEGPSSVGRTKERLAHEHAPHLPFEERVAFENILLHLEAEVVKAIGKHSRAVIPPNIGFAGAAFNHIFAIDYENVCSDLTLAAKEYCREITSTCHS